MADGEADADPDTQSAGPEDDTDLNDQPQVGATEAAAADGADQSPTNEQLLSPTTTNGGGDGGDGGDGGGDGDGDGSDGDGGDGADDEGESDMPAAAVAANEAQVAAKAASPVLVPVSPKSPAAKRAANAAAAAGAGGSGAVPKLDFKTFKLSEWTGATGGGGGTTAFGDDPVHSGPVARYPGLARFGIGLPGADGDHWSPEAAAAAAAAAAGADSAAAVTAAPSLPPLAAGETFDPPSERELDAAGYFHLSDSLKHPFPSLKLTFEQNIKEKREDDLLLELQSDSMQSARARWKQHADGSWAPFGQRAPFGATGPVWKPLPGAGAGTGSSSARVWAPFPSAPRAMAGAGSGIGMGGSAVTTRFDPLSLALIARWKPKPPTSHTFAGTETANHTQPAELHGTEWTERLRAKVVARQQQPNGAGTSRFAPIRGANTQHAGQSSAAPETAPPQPYRPAASNASLRATRHRRTGTKTQRLREELAAATVVQERAAQEAALLALVDEQRAKQAAIKAQRKKERGDAMVFVRTKLPRSGALGATQHRMVGVMTGRSVSLNTSESARLANELKSATSERSRQPTIADADSDSERERDATRTAGGDDEKRRPPSGTGSGSGSPPPATDGVNGLNKSKGAAAGGDADAPVAGVDDDAARYAHLRDRQQQQAVLMRHLAVLRESKIAKQKKIERAINGRLAKVENRLRYLHVIAPVRPSDSGAGSGSRALQPIPFARRSAVESDALGPVVPAAATSWNAAAAAASVSVSGPESARRSGRRHGGDGGAADTNRAGRSSLRPVGMASPAAAGPGAGSVSATAAGSGVSATSRYGPMHDMYRQAREHKQQSLALQHEQAAWFQTRYAHTQPIITLAAAATATPAAPKQTPAPLPPAPPPVVKANVDGTRQLFGSGTIAAADPPAVHFPPNPELAAAPALAPSAASEPTQAATATTATTSASGAPASRRTTAPRHFFVHVPLPAPVASSS